MRPFYWGQKVYTIYSQSSCGFCEMAKKLLEDNEQQYIEIAIDEDDDAKAFVKSFAKTVPQIFYEKKLIGGFQELHEYLLES